MEPRLLGPADVRRLLQRHELAPHRGRGQNFVVDPNTVRKTVRDAQVQAGELVVEVGPGLGSLTLGLVAAGARVVAVEVDAGMLRALTDTLAGTDVQVLHGDALTVDYRALTRGRSAAFVANLPYYAATGIVIGALQQRAFDRLHVMVQREVAERWAAEPGSRTYGAVSVKLAALADVRVVGPVSRQAFYPVPRVDSVTVALRPRPWPGAPDQRRLFDEVERGFAQRRKRLRNALARPPARSAAAVERALVSAGLDPGARAEELGLTQWRGLVRALDAPGHAPGSSRRS